MGAAERDAGHDADRGDDQAGDHPDPAALLDAAQAAGVYDPDAADAAQRRDLLAYLVELGATLDEIVESDRGRNLPSLGADRLMRAGPLSARDLAGAAALPLERVIDTYHQLGLPIGDPDAPGHDEQEARFVELAATAHLGLPEGMTDEILRTTGAAMAAIAEASVSAFVGSVETVLEQQALRSRAETTTATAELALELGTLLGPIFRHHLWQATRRQRTAMAQAPDRLQATLTVGFVDLVGFTEDTATMAAAHLLAFMRDFQRRTYDIVTAQGGRVVKYLGDAIMFSAHDPVAAADIALDLVRAFGTEGERPRGGLAHGTVVARHGDLYGPVVNLAARLADIAVPGEVLASAPVADALAGSPITTEAAGRREIKGFAEPIPVVSLVSRAGPAPGA